MKKYALSTLAVTAALAPPFAAAQARQVNLTTTLKDYGGRNAFVAVYLTDAAGKYQRTLWIAGTKAKYYRDLSDWRRLSGGSLAGIDGVTGASVGSGKTLKISADIADAMIDAGYQIHVDTAVEDGMSNPSEVVAPLSTDAAGKPFAGKGYVKSLTISY
jgi:hypothetical protein